MKQDPPQEASPFEPIEFELVNGHSVRVVADWFWQKPGPTEKREGAKPYRYFAIRVHSTEGNLNRRMACHNEFRAGHDFATGYVRAIWTWLESHVAGPDYRDHDCLEDFVMTLAEVMTKSLVLDEDAAADFQPFSRMFDRLDDLI